MRRAEKPALCYFFGFFTTEVNKHLNFSNAHQITGDLNQHDASKTPDGAQELL